MRRQSLLFQQCRGLNDIAGCDVGDPQQVCKAFGEQAGKDLKRRLAVQSFPDDAVDVREYEIHILLSQGVKGRALREDIAQKGMILLHAGFFAGMIRLAEEQM